jgi:hypothetical protein
MGPLEGRRVMPTGQSHTLLKVSLLSLGEFLTGPRRLLLPWFQRAYAWVDLHYERLLMDLLAAMRDEQGRRHKFLGHIYVAPSGPDGFNLVDGNQRLTTLTLIIAILRDLSGEAEANRLDSLLFKGVDRLPRLQLQPHLAPFFLAHAQARGSTKIDFQPSRSKPKPNLGEEAILNARDGLKAAIMELSDYDRELLARFITDQTFVIVNEAATTEEAAEMLAVEEQTGLKHHAVDVAKISLISVMPADEQETAARAWDQQQMVVGSAGLGLLLPLIRALALKRRSSQPVEEDLVRHFRLNEGGKDFMDRHLVASAQWLDRIGRRRIGRSETRKAIAAHIETVSWHSRPLVLAPALAWLQTHGDDHAKTPEFWRLFERLVWLLRISGSDQTAEERRLLAVVREIGRLDDPARMPSLEIERKMMRQALSNLDSRTFDRRPYAPMVLRLLSLLAGREPGPLEHGEVTVEHVLPRNPDAAGAWAAVGFSSEAKVKAYSGRIGNLVLVDGETNQLADRKSYGEKQEVFRASRGFVLLSEAIQEPAWTPEVIDRRSAQQIATLQRYWGLSD